jgi:glycosyltransferase involved in cell wall biosynthesis
MILITRTHERPNYFSACLNSILTQDFPEKILHIVLFQGTERYVTEVNTQIYRRVVLQCPDVIASGETRRAPENGMRLRHMPWNAHLQIAYDYIEKQGRKKTEIVLAFDDDDMLLPGALRKIYNSCSGVKGTFVALWRVDFKDKIIPDDQHWRRAEICHISGIGFAYPVAMIPHAAYGEWQCGDYRTIKSMMHHADFHVWIDHILTAIQRPAIKKTDGDLPSDGVTVDACNVEFGYELIAAVPYAFYLHQHGRLRETISGPGSEAIYYFSPKHTINPAPRAWANMFQFRNSDIPNTTIHRPEIDLSQFARPEYRKYFGAKIPELSRPVVCICNRYNNEWGGNPINYFDRDCLDRLFGMLKKKYTVVYFAVDIPPEFYDCTVPLEIGDQDFIAEKHPEVLVFQDLRERYQWNWNAFMLLVFSNCQRFITMNGGYSIMASYFGGTNLIYSKQCSEINPKVNSFHRWYNQFGGSRVRHLDNYNDLYDMVEQVYVKEYPLVNILIRTSGRPAFFNECMRSIREQDYKNVEVIVGTDDPESAEYVKKYKVRHVEYTPDMNIPDPPVVIADGKTIYGRKAFYNLYLNELNNAVKDGWVLYHDDDMELKPGMLSKAVARIKSDNDLILWRVLTNGKVVPSDEHFGVPPWNCDITASCLFHSKHLPLIRWEAYRKGNYRVLKILYSQLNPVWINEIMAVTGEVGNGFKKDSSVKINQIYY